MDIAAWLGGLGLSQYEPVFRENGIDAEVLVELTDQHLQQLGLPLGPRLKLLKAIAALRQSEPGAIIPEQTASGGSQNKLREAERRQLTVMFADLVGSTALSERLDLEEMREVITAYQNAVAGVVARFDGHIAKFMGDGVLCYFGWPQAHEDDAERAVRAGLAVTDAVAMLNLPQAQTLGTRIGIATGLVVVGDLIGEGAAQEEAVIGETPNLASRLQALAEPGTVVIAEGTRRLLGELFELENLGVHQLKGIAKPVCCWRVCGERVVEGRFEGHQVGPLLPLVGRNEELALLGRRWQQAVSGEGQVVLLCGEPGIGKSRLVLELRQQTHNPAEATMHLQCSPYHTGSALFPVIGSLERAAGFAREDSAVARLEKLETLLAKSGLEVAGSTALFASLLAIPTNSYPPLELSPQRQKMLTLQVLTDQLAGLAARKPVLLIVEDAHWIDPSTQELLGLIVDRAPSLSILVVITFRPDYLPPWAGRAHVMALTLSRLGRRETMAIIDSVRGAGSVRPAVVEQILAKTDGVPLFVEELTKVVVESGLSSSSRQDVELSRTIPATLQDALMARLDRLSQAKPVAQIGAALGREFSHELLAAVTQLPANELDQALAELTAAELLFRRGIPPDATYSFKHALVQDAAHQSLLRLRRQRLHQMIATVLEEQFPDVGEIHPEVLAGHCLEAGLIEKAIAFLRQAGQQAVARSAMMEAIAHLQQALNLLAGTPDNLTRRRQELELQTMVGVPLMATRGMAAPEVERAYARARELCLEVGDEPQLFPVMFGLWWFYEVRANLSAARELAEQLLAMAQRGNDSSHLIQAHRAMGATLFWSGEFAVSLFHYERAIALYDPQQHRSLAFTYGQEPGVLSRGFAAHVLWYLGYPDRALKMMQESLSMAREVAHPFSLAFALDHSAWLQQYLRDMPQAIELAEADIEYSREQGLPFFLAQGTILHGWALAEQGQEAEGTAEIKLGLAAHEATGALLVRPYWLSLLAWLQSKTGTVEEELRIVEDALALACDQHLWQAELHRLKGELLLIRCSRTTASGVTAPDSRTTADVSNAVASAEAAFQEAIEIARRQEARSLELRAATSLARLWGRQGRHTEAWALLRPIFGWFTEGFDTRDLLEAKALLDDLG